jgi:hypothetical protein
VAQRITRCRENGDDVGGGGVRHGTHHR